MKLLNVIIQKSIGLSVRILRWPELSDVYA